MIVLKGARATSRELCRSRRSWLTIPCAALAMLSIMLASPIADAAAPSASSPTWSIANTPNVTGASGDVLNGVSCVSQSFCVAVGDDINSSLADQTLALTYSVSPGYRFVASDGGIFGFNAKFYGSMGAKHLNAPIVGMATG